MAEARDPEAVIPKAEKADLEEEDNATKLKLTLRFLKIQWRTIFLIMWPIVCLPVMLYTYSSNPGKEHLKFRCLYAMLIVAGYWVTECIPLYISGLMPVFLLPLMNIMDSNTTCSFYFKEVNMVFMTGIMLAICIEACNLHKRIALFTITVVGCNPIKLLLGLCYITSLLSTWLANAAVTSMMCPIIKGVLDALDAEGIIEHTLKQTEEEIQQGETPRPSKCSIAFYLAISYCSGIGGTGTLVGTPTNLAYSGIVEAKYKDGENIEFLSWILFALPVWVTCTFLAWLWLAFVHLGFGKRNKGDKKNVGRKSQAYETMKAKYRELGKLSWHEIAVGVLFLLCLMLWIFRSPKFMDGWAHLVVKNADWIPQKERGKFVKASVPAMLTLFLMFCVPAVVQCKEYWSKYPSRRPTKMGPGLIKWVTLNQKMPWGVLFILGGGFTLSAAGKASGMSNWLAEQLTSIANLNPFLILVLVIFFALLLTEVMANAAMCSLLAPVILDLAATSKRFHPFFLGNALCIACSMAFLLPGGTPPNAIVAGYANIKTVDMIMGGIGVKIMAFIVIVTLSPTWGKLFWNLGEFPEWASLNHTTAARS